MGHRPLSPLPLRALASRPGPSGSTTWTIWPLVGVTGKSSPSHRAVLPDHAPPATTRASQGTTSWTPRTAPTRSPWRSRPTASIDRIVTPRRCAATRTAVHSARPSTRAADGLCRARHSAPRGGNMARASSTGTSETPGLRAVTSAWASVNHGSSCSAWATTSDPHSAKASGPGSAPSSARRATRARRCRAAARPNANHSGSGSRYVSGDTIPAPASEARPGCEASTRATLAPRQASS